MVVGSRYVAAAVKRAYQRSQIDGVELWITVTTIATDQR